MYLRCPKLQRFIRDSYYLYYITQILHISQFTPNIKEYTIYFFRNYFTAI